MKHLYVTPLLTIYTASIGLLGTKQAYPVYLQSRFGIHTFGMKYSIDVIILDDTFTIKAMRHSLPPNRIFVWNPRYKHIIEAHSGFILDHSLSQGDNISVHYTEKIRKKAYEYQ